jgi:hypothetical protein
MRVRTAIAMVILVAAVVMGCGDSAPARAAKGGAEEAEGGIVEETGGPRDVEEGEWSPAKKVGFARGSASSVRGTAAGVGGR